MAFSRGIGNFGVRGPRSAAAAVPFDPETLPNVIAIFDPNQGTYSDAGSTPAAVDEAVYRWVASYPGDGSKYFDQATEARRLILREGANGMKWLDGSAGGKWADWSQSLTLPLTMVFGTKSVLVSQFAAYMGPPDSANLAVRQYGDTDNLLAMSADGTTDTLVFPTDDPEAFRAYSCVWNASGSTNKARRYGTSDTTIASADLASSVNAWRLQGFFSDGASGVSKASFTYLIVCSSELSDADRAKAEKYIYDRLPT